MSRHLMAKYRTGPQGRLLTLGEMTRHNHEECGDTKKRLYVQRVTRGFLFHCHNCAPEYSGLCPVAGLPVPAPSATVAALAAINSNLTVSDGNHHVFPEDYTQTLSPEWAKWLAVYGLTDEEIISAGIGWSPSSGHLILPTVTEDQTASGQVVEQISAWIERTTPAPKAGQPKYLSRMPTNPTADDHMYIHKNKPNEIILVEDYISTIKCGRVLSTLCLNGSYVHPYLYECLRTFDIVWLWLDHDKKTTAIKMMVQLRKLGINMRMLDHINDPKYLGDMYIKQMIDEKRESYQSSGMSLENGRLVSYE